MNKLALPFITYLSIFSLAADIALSRAGEYPPLWVFWVMIFLTFSLIVYQITLSKNLRVHQVLLFFLQITVMALLFRIQFISGENVLAGYDANNEYVALYQIANEGRWSPETSSIVGSSYPLLYIFGLEWSQILNVDLFSTAKWLPISIFYIAPLFLYLIARLKYGSMTGLFAIFGFSFLYISLVFHSILQRETMAIPLFLMAIYFYLKATSQDSGRHALLSLSVFAVIACVLAHHMTSFILLIFFIILFSSNRLILIFRGVRNDRSISEARREERTSGHFIFFIAATIFGYWIFLKNSPLDFFGLIFREAAIFQPGIGAIFPSSLRMSILLTGEILFAIIFATISFIAVILRRKNMKTSDLAFLLFSGFMGLAMILTISGGLLQWEGMGLGSRFQTYVYIGLLLLSGYTAYFVLSRYKNRKFLKRVIPLVLITFVIFNIYRIPPYLYSETDAQPGDVRILVTEAEQIAVLWLGINNRDTVQLGDPSNAFSFPLTKLVIDKHGIENPRIGYLIQSEFSTNLLDPSNDMSYQKIFSNGDASIFVSY